jgi:ABC-2 type transport system permease protein
LLLVVIGVGLSSLGFLIAWRLDSTQGFHAIMNLCLMPMWLLSGAFFPREGASRWLQWAMTVNPLTYGVDALRQVMYLGSSHAGPGSGSLVTPVAVTVISAGIMLWLAVRASSRVT